MRACFASGRTDGDLGLEFNQPLHTSLHAIHLILIAQRVPTRKKNVQKFMLFRGITSSGTALEAGVNIEYHPEAVSPLILDDAMLPQGSPQCATLRPASRDLLTSSLASAV